MQIHDSKAISPKANTRGAVAALRLLAAIAIAILALGAGPSIAQPTIYVEIDYMIGGTPFHNHKPSPSEIAAVVQMFACHGYVLVVDVDDAIEHVESVHCTDLTRPFFTCTTPQSFRTIRNDHFDNGAGWHYCIFGHDYNSGSGTGSSGIGEISGDDLMVTLGSFTGQIGTSFDRAATFAHELGHNLGLEHWGIGSLALGPYQPNYASIMSYQFQLHGVRSQLLCLGMAAASSLYKELDYSDGRLPLLTEGALEELRGVGIHSVDWDCDVVLEGGFASEDLDETRPPWCISTGTTASVLVDFDDWHNITDVAIRPDFDPDAELRVVTCITAAEGASYRNRVNSTIQDPSLCPGAQPILEWEPCESGQMIWVDDAYTGLETGTGDHPYEKLQDAHNAAPGGSVLYLQAGNHSNGGVPVFLTKNLTLAGPGGATIDP